MKGEGVGRRAGGHRLRCGVGRPGALDRLRLRRGHGAPSAMGASVLRKKVTDAGFGDVTVVNQSIANLTDTYDLVVSHQDLTARAREDALGHPVSVDNFMASPRYDEIVGLPEARNDSGGAAPVAADGLLVGDCGPRPREHRPRRRRGRPRRRDHPGRRALVAAGGRRAGLRRRDARARAVGVDRDGTCSRSRTAPTRRSRRSGRPSPLHTRTGIDWNGREVKFVVGIAALGNEHLQLRASDRGGSPTTPRCSAWSRRPRPTTCWPSWEWCSPSRSDRA